MNNAADIGNAADLRNAADWDAILAAMEADLAEANENLEWRDVPPPELMATPEATGPLPAELRERAIRIHNAQGQTIRRLTEHRDQVGRHLAALRSIPSALDGAAAAYLDVTG